MMTVSQPPKPGLYGVALTCFGAGGRLDESAFERHLAFCVGCDVEGLVLCGSTGEFLYLDETAYARVLEMGARAAAGKFSVIAGACAPHEAGVVRCLEKAAALGYECALVCPPYYYPQKQAQVLDFYRAVCTRAPRGMGILLYNIPFCTAGIPLAILPALLELDNIVGMKDSSGDMLYFSAALLAMQERRPDAVLFTGQDAALLAGLAIGAHGCISSAALLLNRFDRAICGAAARRDMEAARVYHKALVRILRKLEDIPFPENYRALAGVLRVEGGRPQRAYSELEGQPFEAWKKEVHACCINSSIGHLCES